MLQLYFNYSLFTTLLNHFNSSIIESDFRDATKFLSETKNEGKTGRKTEQKLSGHKRTSLSTIISFMSLDKPLIETSLDMLIAAVFVWESLEGSEHLLNIAAVPGEQRMEWVYLLARHELETRISNTGEYKAGEIMHDNVLSWCYQQYPADTDGHDMNRSFQMWTECKLWAQILPSLTSGSCRGRYPWCRSWNPPFLKKEKSHGEIKHRNWDLTRPDSIKFAPSQQQNCSGKASEAKAELTLFAFESLLIVSVVGSWHRLLVPEGRVL